eukprot:766982-Hanusia_phi.AAC.2
MPLGPAVGSPLHPALPHESDPGARHGPCAALSTPGGYRLAPTRREKPSRRVSAATKRTLKGHAARSESWHREPGGEAADGYYLKPGPLVLFQVPGTVTVPRLPPRLPGQQAYPGGILGSSVKQRQQNVQTVIFQVPPRVFCG